MHLGEVMKVDIGEDEMMFGKVLVEGGRFPLKVTSHMVEGRANIYLSTDQLKPSSRDH